MAGAYKATPIPVLEAKTFISLLDLYLDAKLAQFRLRYKESGMERLINEACVSIQNKLRRERWGRRPLRRSAQQGELIEEEARTKWAEF